MLNLILLANMVSSSCDWGKYDNPDYPTSGPECYDCSSACGDCDGPTEFDCTQCSSSYSSIQGICMSNCPLGYSKSGESCTSSSSDGLSYSLDFTLISNTISDTVGVSSGNIVLYAGSSGSFYPYYESTDPYTIKSRGFYFDGSAYIWNNKYEVTFGPVFTVAMWVKPTNGNGYLFAKQNTSDIVLGIKISNYVPKLEFYLGGLQSFTASKALNANYWNFLMTKMTLSDYKAVISITVNSTSSSSSTYSSYFKDIYTDFSTTYGAQYSGSSYQDFFTGYMWSFMIGNDDLAASTFIQTSGCGGCSACPANNNDECLSSCTFNQYIEDGACKDCNSNCQTFGCVRNDKTCNLCYDRLCLNCTTFEAGCTYCIDHAYLESSTKCVCYEGYIWDEDEEKCKPCVKNCKTCNGGGYLGCSECKTGYYMLWGICYSACPTGYSVSGTECVLTGSERIMDMLFNKVQGVVYDSVNSIPAVTGTSSTFYPDYESDDPIAAYSRGYYFRGSSIMNYAPYSTYTSPYLIFSSVFYIGIWFNPSASTGILFSSVNPSYNIILQYSIQSLKPRIKIGLYSLVTEVFEYPSITCTNSAYLKSWNYVLFKLNLSQKGKTSITCYVNTVEESSQEAGSGFLFDETDSNYMMAGTQRSDSSTYDSSYYQGFIYHIMVDVDVDNPGAEVSADCTGGCTFCVKGGTCLNDCEISEYQSGTGYQDCSECNENCKDLGCRDNTDTCNICGDPGCKECSTYEYDDCDVYFCSDGQYQSSDGSTCLDCDSTCTTCNGEGPASCKSCTSSYLLNKACHSFCPTGYSSSSNKCTQTLSHILSLNLQQIKGLVPDSQSSFVSLTGSSSSFYPTFDSSDPWPQIYRGYYFNGASYLQLPPNSADSSTITFGNAFVFTFWIRAKSDGIVIVKQDSSYDYCLRIYLTGFKLAVDFKLSSISSASSSTSLGSIWNYVIVRVKFLSTGKSYLEVVVNGNTESFSLGDGAYEDLQSSFTMTVGAVLGSSGYSSYFTGFLYTFDVYSSYVDVSDYTSSCDESDFSCSVCPTSTGACIDLCEVDYWYDGSSCQECQDSSYSSCRRNDKNCNLCKDVQCKICDTFDSGSCSECRPHATLTDGECDCSDGYVWDHSSESCVVCDTSSKVKLQGVCLDSCPTGYTASSGECTGTSGLIFNIKLDKLISGSVADTVNGDITVTTGPTSEFYPYYDDEDPYAGKDRGYYYNGYSSYMEIASSSSNDEQLVLSPEFSISFWVYPVDSGVIFTKQSGTSTFVKIEILDSKYVQVSAQLSGASSLSIVLSANQVVINDWNFVGVTCSLSDDIVTSITVQVNNQRKSQEIGVGAYVDPTSSYTAILGAEYNSSGLLSNYFTGYINSVSVWNTDEDLKSQVLTSCTGGCSYCPNSGTCLPDCSVKQYYSSSSCSSCSSKCDKGCVRSEDCNLCSDRLCELCSDYTSSGCTKCVDGAEMVSSVCECITGSPKSRPNGNLYCATDCFKNCKTCYNSYEGDCTTCQDNYFLDPSGICLSQCQSGYKAQNGKCTESKAKSKILHYIFNTTVNNPEDKTSKLKAFMGSSESYIGDYDENDPQAFYKRGIYFDGQAKYVQLPPNPAESTNIVLGNVHSIKFWVRAKSSSTSGTLAVKESDSDFTLYIYLENLIPKASYKLKDIYSGDSKTLTVNGKSLSLNTWTELVLVFKRNGRSSTARFYVNGKTLAKAFAYKSYLDEGLDQKFKLGYSVSQSTSFDGFIYEFIIFNYEIVPSDPETYSCYCDQCTQDGDCLNDCEASEYIEDDGSCAACSDECPSGCRSESNCGQNPDPYCEKYTGFESKQCTKCKKLGQLTSSGCKCVDNSSMINKVCTCKDQYEELQNSCVPCYYHLQSSDIEGYFSPDYLSIVFDFSQAIQTSSSSDCSKLFTSDSYSQLGDSPKCTHLDNHKKLQVQLGFDASVVNGTELWFAENSLLTNTKTCGSFRGPINQTVYFVYEVPTIDPVAVIDAPFQYFIDCGNLIISGKRSKGGYGRRLKFLWDFESVSNKNEFNLTDYTLVNYEFKNNSIEEDKLKVSLTVTNWLKFENSVSQSIKLNQGPGIDLVYDKDVNWQITTSMSKSIFVQATSLCYISDNLTYTWDLDSKTGKDAKINEQLLWGSQKSQSKLYIPKGSLGPGDYVFKVSVHDNELDLDGETFIPLQVVYSDLVINFNPPYKTVNRLEDLILDGSVAFDPDNTADSSSYEWNCTGVDSCEDLIQNPGKESTFISKSDLLDLQEYVFTLKYSKGSRSTSANLTVLVNDSSKISVKFSFVPDYINNQENFIIISTIDPPCNCSYYWQVLSGGRYKMNTDPSSKDIGFKPFSMITGSKYKLQLTVFDTDGGENYFQQFVKVNVPPLGGEFTANKVKGDEMRTLFKFQADGWKDFEDATWPLSYQFGYYKEGDPYYINVRNESAFYYSKLPAGSPLLTFVRVYDKHGGYSEKVMEVQVEPSDLDPEAILNEFQVYLDSDKFDVETLVGYLTNIAWVFKTYPFNSTYQDRAFNLSVLSVVKLIDSMQDIDFSKIDVLFSLANVATLYDLDLEKRKLLYQMISEFSQVISDNDVIMSESRANEFVKVLSKLVDFTPTTIEKKAEDLGQANEVLKGLAMASSVSMAQTQSMIFGKSPIKCYLKLFKGDDVLSFKVPDELNDTMIAIPEDPSFMFLSSSTIMIILNAYNSESDLYTNNTEEQSAAIEFSLVEIINNTQSIIDIQLKDSRINISIPVWNVDKMPPKCAYWKTDKWSKKGCKHLAFEQNRSICGCTHTSLYSSGSHFGFSSGGDDDGGPILIYLVCLVALLWIFLACCLLVKDRKESESKIFVAKIIAALPEGKKAPVYIENKIADQLGRPDPADKYERKDSVHVPVDKIAVVEYDSKRLETQFNFAECEEPKSTDKDGEVKNRRLALPLGYQILPAAEFPGKEKAHEARTGAFEYGKQEPKIQTIEKKQDMTESEKAAGFSPGDRIQSVSQVAPTSSIIGKDVEKAPTGPGFAHMGRIEDLEPEPGSSHQNIPIAPLIPRSPMTSGSTNRTEKPEAKENRVQLGKIEGLALSKPQDFSNSESSDGFSMQRMGAFEAFKQGPDFSPIAGGPQRGPGYTGQGVRIGKVSDLEFEKESSQKNENNYLSYSASRDLRLTEFEPRPGTDGKFMVQGLGNSGIASQGKPFHLEGVTELNLDDSPIPPNPAASQAGYNPVSRMGGPSDLNLQSSQAKPNYSQNPTGYSAAPRLSGLTEFQNVEPGSKPSPPPNPNPDAGSRPSVRLAGVSELNLEDVGQASKAEPNPRAGYTSAPRLSGLTELKSEDLPSSQAKPTGRFGSGSKPAEAFRSPLESPAHGDFEKKPFLSSVESQEKLNILKQDDYNDEVKGHSSKRSNDRYPTQAYEERLFKGTQHLEEAKQENLGSDLNSGKEAGRYPENTELFTQPDSPNHRHLIRRKKADNQEVPMFEEPEDIRYPGFIADYYFSAPLFYHENYSRFGRCAQGVCAFLMQTILIGLIISGMGTSYAQDKGKSFDSILQNLLFQDVAVAFSMVIVSNLFMGALLCLFYKRPSVIAGSEEVKYDRRKEFIGLVFILLIIFGTVIGVGLLELTMDHYFSMLWVICLFIGFVFDFFFVQMIKVLVYNYFSPYLILPI